MVATNAFGMGIDKSNVSYVIHCNMPKSVEAYYQEAGRAGRDGAPADCILLFSPGDITTAKYLILNQTENDELTDEERQAVQAQDLIRLEQMTGYCKTTGCLRGYLLDYFGQPHAPRCENCGNCQAEYDLQDLTREAQMILSCVVRVRTRLGYCVGTALLGQVLRGSRAARVRELGLEDLPTYGLMRDLPAGRIRELLELLEAGGYLQTDPVHGGVDTTPQAAEVLFHGQRVEVSVKRQPLQDQPARGRAKAKAERPKKAEDDLLAALKALRLRLSQEQHIPAYIICTNATLLDMAARRPRTIEELLEVSGIGQAKAERFGDEPERGARCRACYALRLFRAAEFARANGFPWLCSTLSVSPHKNADWVNELGEEAAGRAGVRWLPSDFKKENGYLRSLALSKEYGLYRQSWCGCEFSYRESRKRAEKEG